MRRGNGRRSGGGGGRGNGNGNSRVSRGGRHGRGRGPRQSRRNPRQSAESGNQRERIAIESGDLVLIDQFMLANPQFIEKITAALDSDAAVKNEIIRDYGGTVITLNRGTYRIERDPFAFTIIVHPEGQEVEKDDVQGDATEALGRIFIETRCLAMVDRELLDDSSLLEKYQELWFSGQDKACRDLLRDNGGAVRYGFRRDGDELGIYQVPGQDIVALWPDQIEDELGAEESKTEEAAA
jgi:hypothetical protein